MKFSKIASLFLAAFFLSFAIAQAQYGGATYTEASNVSEERSQNIVDVVTNNSEFSTLAMLLTEAGLADAVRDADGLTVFAPTNAAFEEVPEETLQALLADRELLQEVLLTHVIGSVVTSDVVTQLEEAPTAANNVLPVNTSYNGTVTVGNATVTDVDIMASNGVIHVVDAVIMPPAERSSYDRSSSY
ncbi:MAG: fasciclin domain-containing protein [Candidatus Cyclonatronum sp.]|uniref:fasciclin domain-containing protein n=1 Tax=Cyclonatronum sp. TaxID=3024185 RepID=UPI0025C0CBDE|nr:fasciclin domain-containing protein [Cyclonatronum sp.]MCC5932617.1 fasciclin domain-containing protein [Balneolales bacterium]MCH8487647.1 fasciclin domain-containing protein [Cyclonatronum sp.]